MTEQKAKKSPAGGVLVGKREGQTIIHDKGTQGGYFVGKLHKEGGIKGINKSTGQPIEVQGGEVIITAPAVADQTKREFEGQMLTNREILSKINEKGGGVSLENGGEIYFNGSSYNYGGKTMTDYEIMQSMNDCGSEREYKKGGVVTYKDKYNKKFKYPKGTSHDLEQISKDTGISIKGLQKIYNKGIGAYKTNPESVRPNVKSKEQWAMARVYSAVMGGKASKVDSNELKMNTGGHLSKGMTLKQIADKHNVTLSEINNQVKLGLKAESEHTSSKREQMKIVKDHLYENPNYYTILKKVGLKRGGNLDLSKESKKGDHPSRDLNNYNDLMDVGVDGQVGAETGLYADGGNLDFLDEAVEKFDDGGATTNQVDAIRLDSSSATYSGSMPKTEYNSYKEFISDLQSVFIDKNKFGGYFYFYVLKNGEKITPTRLAIQFKNTKNTVLNFNPLTGKSSDFYKQLERRYGSTIRRNNLDFTNWLGGKATPKPQPQPEPTKEKAIRIRFSIVENNNLIAEDSFFYVSAFFEYLKVFSDRDVKVTIDLERIGGTYIANDSFYLQKENEDIRHFNINEVPLGILDRFFVNYFPNVDLSALFRGKENVPEKMSVKELTDFFNQEPSPAPQPKPIKEEVRIDFEATKKYLNLRIADLTKELNFKKPRLSNEEIGFYQRDINNLIEKLRIANEKELEFLPLKDRLESAYALKWGNINAEFTPSKDLLAPNGLPTKLTDEEWVNVRSPYFSSFFGDWRLANEIGDFSGVSKVIDPETKEPMPVYHGTNVLFTEWKTYKTNNAHYFAKNRDFSQWFAEQWSKGRGDVSAKDSNLLKALNPNKGEYLYRCFLDIKNPIDFSRFGVEKRPVSDFLMFLQINYNIGDFDFWTNFRLFNNLAQDTLVYSWMIIRNWQSFTEYVKMATTYDGYIFYEYHPDKVGTGLDGASLSFCAFDSNQIKFTTATEFNALITDSRFEQGGKL